METAVITKVQLEEFLKEEGFEDKLADICDQIDACSDMDECRPHSKALADLIARTYVRFYTHQVVMKMCNDLGIGGNGKNQDDI